jgi:tetratricopeptide (TPR) repeat protein
MAVNYDGPFDEPTLALGFGQTLAQGENLRQAAQLFHRVLALRSGDADTEIALAKTFIDLGLPDRAVAVVRGMRTPSLDAQRLEILRVESLAYLAKNDFSTAEKVLQTAQQGNPKDQNRLAILAEFYRVTGYAALRAGQKDVIKQRFDKALATLEKQLQLESDSAGVLLIKSELLMQLGSYDQAIATLNRLLQAHPGHTSGLMNRAIAHLLTKKYADAKRDYEMLQKLLPQQPYAIYYGLAEIAFQQHDNKTAIKNFRLYLKHGPVGTPEYKQVTERLRRLESGS